MLKWVIVAAIVWWFFVRKAHAATGVIQGAGPDFDPLTASQLGGAAGVTGGVTVGDEWSATFIEGNGNWSDAYRSHAIEGDGMPL